MSRLCDYCGKGPQFGNSIRHVHGGQWERKAPKTKKKWLPNLQAAKVLKAGVLTRVRICAKCLKAGKTIQAG